MRKNKLPITLEAEEAQNLLKQPSKRYPTGLRNKTMMALMRRYRNYQQALQSLKYSRD